MFKRISYIANFLFINSVAWITIREITRNALSRRARQNTAVSWNDNTSLPHIVFEITARYDQACVCIRTPCEAWIDRKSIILAKIIGSIAVAEHTVETVCKARVIIDCPGGVEAQFLASKASAAQINLVGCFSLRLFANNIDDATNIALAEKSRTWATQNFYAFK